MPGGGSFAPLGPEVLASVAVAQRFHARSKQRARQLMDVARLVRGHCGADLAALDGLAAAVERLQAGQLPDDGAAHREAVALRWREALLGPGGDRDATLQALVAAVLRAGPDSRMSFDKQGLQQLVRQAAKERERHEAAAGAGEAGEVGEAAAGQKRKKPAAKKLLAALREVAELEAEAEEAEAEGEWVEE